MKKYSRAKAKKVIEKLKVDSYKFGKIVEFEDSTYSAPDAYRTSNDKRNMKELGLGMESSEGKPIKVKPFKKESIFNKIIKYFKK